MDLITLKCDKICDYNWLPTVQLFNLIPTLLYE